jgi:hypothetical protein
MSMTDYEMRRQVSDVKYMKKELFVIKLAMMFVAPSAIIGYILLLIHVANTK